MIVICAPYGRNEVTAAALRLADLAVGRGHEVRLVAVGTREQGRHSFWDRRVRGTRRRSLYRAALGARHVVYFQPFAAYRELTRWAAPRAEHTLVASWHSLQPDAVKDLAGYDAVVCPSKACRALLARQRPGNLHLVRWDAGLAYTRHDGTVEKGRRRWLLYCDAAVIDWRPLQVLQLAAQLLAEAPDLSLTVLSSKAWPRRQRASSARLLTAWGARLVFLTQGDWDDQVRLLQEHDVLLVPSVRSDFGLTASRGLACGLPVVCYDLPPWSELVGDGVQGLLVPCTRLRGPLGALTARPALRSFLERSRELLTDPRRLARLQTADWQPERRTRRFEDYWLRAWG